MPEVRRAHALTLFKAADAEFEKYRALELAWGAPPSPEVEFKATLTAKTAALGHVQVAYTSVVHTKDHELAVAALVRMGMAYQEFGIKLRNAPMPPGAPEELQEAIREELDRQALPIDDKAIESFEAALSKAKELDVRTEFVSLAAAQLRALRKTR